MTATTTPYRALYMTGRCRSGTDNAGQIAHAVPGVGTVYGDDFQPALCGKRPGARGNGWSCYPAQEVTCEKCLKRLGN